mmetsp:Transcript_40866/g.127312  ORF Transcript_40866/g.127312 Transcript_40866/m.127312 type:complete len:174 (+) Transcript_40866:1783-2304(+)
MPVAEGGETMVFRCIALQDNCVIRGRSEASEGGGLGALMGVSWGRLAGLLGELQLVLELPRSRLIPCAIHDGSPGMRRFPVCVLSASPGCPPRPRTRAVSCCWPPAAWGRGTVHHLELLHTSYLQRQPTLLAAHPVAMDMFCHHLLARLHTCVGPPVIQVPGPAVSDPIAADA